MDRTCTVCGKVSVTKYGSWDHMKTHDPVNKPIECDLGCIHTYFKEKLLLLEHYAQCHPDVRELDTILASYIKDIIFLLNCSGESIRDT